MVIEKGIVSDLDELAELYDALNDHLATTENYPGWLKGIYPVRETARQGIEEDSLFVVRKGERIIGSIILNHLSEEAYDQIGWQFESDYTDVLVVRTLVVHPSFLKIGIGEGLLEFARQYTIRQGMRSLRLDVSEHNLPAIRLYEKMGYKYMGRVDLGLPYEHLKWFRLYELVV